MKPSRLEWLDLFRGVAAIVVVLFHYRAYLGIAHLEFGNLAVDVFFVLSGIVLGRKYGAEIAGGMSFWKFAKVRLIRLYPMTLLAGCFIVAMTLAGLPGSKVSAVSADMAWTVFLVTPLPGHWPRGVSFPPDPPVWSLWAELVTNAIWFVAMRTSPRLVRLACPALLALLLVLAWKHRTMGDGFQQGTWMLSFALVRALAWFTVGHLIGTATRAPLAPARWLTPALFLALAAYPFGLPAWLASFAVVAIAALLLQSLIFTGAPGPALGRVCRWLGMLSFPLYLTHLPAARLLPDLAPGAGRAAVLLLVVGGTALLATLASEALVRALQRLDRRYTAGSRTPPLSTLETGP